MVGLVVVGLVVGGLVVGLVGGLVVGGLVVGGLVVMDLEVVMRVAEIVEVAKVAEVMVVVVVVVVVGKGAAILVDKVEATKEVAASVITAKMEMVVLHFLNTRFLFSHFATQLAFPSRRVQMVVECFAEFLRQF